MVSSISNFPIEVQTTFNSINSPIDQLPEHIWKKTRSGSDDREVHLIATIEFPKAGPSVTRISLDNEQGIAFQITAKKTRDMGVVILIPPPQGIGSVWDLRIGSLADRNIDRDIESDTSGWIRRIVNGTDEEFQLVVPFSPLNSARGSSLSPAAVPTVLAVPLAGSPSLEPEAFADGKSSAGEPPVGGSRAPADVGGRAGPGEGLVRSTPLPPPTLLQRILAPIATVAGAIWRLIASLFSALSSCLRQFRRA